MIAGLLWDAVSDTPAISISNIHIVSCVVFVDRWLSFCPFSFGHCVVSPCQVYGFWLSLWYLQTFHVLFDIVLSVLLRFTAFDYPFGIFKLFPLTRTGFREFLPSGFDVWFLYIPHKDRVDIITGKTNDTTPSEQLQNQIGYSLKGKTNRDPSHTNAMYNYILTHTWHCPVENFSLVSTNI